MKTKDLAIPIVLVLGFMAFLPNAQAISPAPDGCYPNFTTAEGCNALNSLTTGAGNTGVGWYSLFLDTTGSYNTGVGGGALALNNADSNTAVGAAALLLNTTGTLNTAVGTDALVYNDSGSNNNAFGAFALLSNTTGNDNTALGFAALELNSTGSANTAIGSEALAFNTGIDNTATGFQALLGNTTGGSNTANGALALLNNTTGNENTANGVHALRQNTTGFVNTAIGEEALLFNTTGNGNTATGASALFNSTTGTDNTAVGTDALFSNTTGFNNTALGVQAGIDVTTANNVICIGNPGANVNDSCFIGNIRGITTANNNAIPVLIDSAGQLGTMSSSRRFKKEIKPMEKASDAILALKPVTFQYKSDNTNTPQFGLIAEEVAAVSPDLVVRDEHGEIYTVRYDQVNAMLLNEFLKEHRKVEAQQAAIVDLKSTVARQAATITRQQKGMDLLATQLKEQAAQIQKVSAQMGVGKPVARIALSNP